MSFKIDINDIPEQFIDVVERIEIDNFIELCDLLGGTLVYLPSLKTLEKSKRNRSIIQDYDGKNYKQLSRKYKISEPYIRRLINEYKKK